MSFGNDGRGNPPNGPNMWNPPSTPGQGWAQPQQPAFPPTQAQPQQPAFPPTQAQPQFPPAQPPPGFGGAPAPTPAFGGAAFGPIGGPTGSGLPGSNESMFEVAVPLQFRMPTRCACCLAPSTTTLTAMAQARHARTTETRKINVPYCARCASHVKAGSRRGKALALLAIVVGSLAPLGLQFAWEYVPAWLFVAMGILMPFAALFVLDRVWKAAPVDHTQGCTASAKPAGWIDGFGFHAPTTRMRFTNPTFAGEVAQLHNVAPQSRGVRKGVNARWIVAPIVAGLATIPAFFGMHTHLYFDNPGYTPLTFVLDDGLASITVGPGGHDDLYVPAGEIHVAVQNNGTTVLNIDGEADHFGKAAVTPIDSVCYGRIERAYGTARSGGSTREPRGVHWHDLSGIDYVFERGPSTVSVSQGQSGATRREFIRIDCATE